MCEEPYLELPRLAFGDQLDVLLASKTETIRYLYSQEWKQRFGALLLLERHWELTSDLLVPICDYRIKIDDEPQVVCFALSIIGRVMAGKFDHERWKLLASIVVNSLADQIVRVSAFKALRRINSEVQYPVCLPSLIEKARNDFELAKKKSVSAPDLVWVSQFL